MTDDEYFERIAVFGFCLVMLCLIGIIVTTGQFMASQPIQRPVHKPTPPAPKPAHRIETATKMSDMNERS